MAISSHVEADLRSYLLLLATSMILVAGCGESHITSSSSSDSDFLQPEITDYQVLFSIDPTKDQQSISPYIYGTNMESEVRSGVKMYRMGGNRWTTYNWENNASNSGNDNDHTNGNWLCVLQSCSAQNANKPGEAIRLGVQRAFVAGAVPLVTIPIGDYLAADKTTRVTQNASVNPAPWKNNKAVRSSGVPSVNPDLSDADVYQEETVKFVQDTFVGELLSGKKIFYMLDNEPGLWASTHKYAHPNKVTYSELVARTIEYGSMIKNRAPGSVVFGGVAYGYNEMNSLQDAPDRILGDSQNITFFEYFLNQMKNEELVQGRRLVDVLDMHWGSEAKGGGYRISNKESLTPNTPEVVAARLQAPRSLWDPTYTEDSWISADMTSGPIALIPKLKAMINRSYPGTKLSFSEYAHGGEKHISGALAQVDTLGIFAREGIFAASHWDREDEAPYIYGALRLFTDYSGSGDAVGDTSVRARTSDVVKTSVYAMTSTASTSRLYIIALNKTQQSLKVKIELPSGQSYSYRSSYEIRTSYLPTQTPHLGLGRGTAFGPTLPAMSATLYIFEK